MKRRAVVALALFALAGCASRMEKSVSEQAAHDFTCPAGDIVIEELSFGEYRATGCGKRVSYQVVGECYFEWNPCHAAKLSKVQVVPAGKNK